MKLDLALSSENPDTKIDSLFNNVGMIRSEYIYRRLGKYILSSEAQAELFSYLDNICTRYSERSIWFRFCDAPANEINMLQDYDEYILEEFPTIGVRGMRRAMLFPDTFGIEAKIVCEVAKKHKNLNILIPYVTDISEVQFAMSMLERNGFSNDIGMMMETPSAFIQRDMYKNIGLSYFLIGLNDLSSLTLGASRGSGFDSKTHPVIKHQIEAIRETYYDSYVSVGGYVDPDVQEMVKDVGLDSITVHYSAYPKFLNMDCSNWCDMNFMPSFKTEDNRKRIKEWAGALLDALNSNQVNEQGLQWKKQ